MSANLIEVPSVSLREQAQRKLSGPAAVRTGFETTESFELLLREAKLLSNSEMVPEMFRAQIAVKKGAQRGTYVNNPSALPNCVLALNMANRLNMDVLMLMKNLLMINGNLAWSSQYVIASVNRTTRFSAVQYDITREENEEVIEHETRSWNEQNRRMETQRKKTALKNIRCVAWATEKATGNRVESPEVSLRMAVLEGWMDKDGSKWKTMPEVMLRYRAASFFGKLYVPESMMGLPGADEVLDGYDEFPDMDPAPIHEVSGAHPAVNAPEEKPATAPVINARRSAGNGQPSGVAQAEAGGKTAKVVEPRQPDGARARPAVAASRSEPRAPSGKPAAVAPEPPEFQELTDEELIFADEEYERLND